MSTQVSKFPSRKQACRRFSSVPGAARLPAVGGVTNSSRPLSTLVTSYASTAAAADTTISRRIAGRRAHRTYRELLISFRAVRLASCLTSIYTRR